jgi:hypothetical protein
MTTTTATTTKTKNSGKESRAFRALSLQEESAKRT